MAFAGERKILPNYNEIGGRTSPKWNKDVCLNMTTEPAGGGLSLRNQVHIFGIDLSQYSKTLQFLILTLGVFFFYLIYGYIQVSSRERVSTYCFTLISIIVCVSKTEHYEIMTIKNS